MPVKPAFANENIPVVFSSDNGYALYLGVCIRSLIANSSSNHNYDIVIGAMADDQIYNYISDYIEGVITRDQFWSLAKFKYPTHQINFCTEKALKCLEYRGFEEVV